MRIPRWWVSLLGVGCCGFVGCSQTGWLRPNDPAGMKTVASIDGKPVSTATGEPGSGLARREDIDDLGPPTAAGSRISGRVFDDEGRAVPNARVRLGVGGSTGGRVNFATTDRSGAFTLHGLRPGRDYTLIAEYQAEDGMMSGRVQAHAPDTGIRIALGARDTGTEPRGTKILPARVRSSLFPDNETDGFPAAARPRVQDAQDRPAQDREPPAEEATSYSPRPKRPSTARLASAPSSGSGTVRAGWTVRQQPSEVASRRSRNDADTDEPPAPDDRGVGGDDGENPLPPALEPVGSDAPRSSGRVSSGPAATARDGVRVSSYQRNARARRPASSSVDGDFSDDREPGSFTTAPRPIPEDAFPAATEIAPASDARGASRSVDENIDPEPRRPVNNRRGPRAASPTASRSRDAVRSDAGDDAATDDSTGDAPTRTRSTRRPTWRELSITPNDVPVDEALRRSSVDEEPDDRDAVKRAVGSVSRSPADGGQADDPAADDEGQPPAPRAARAGYRPIARDDEARPRRNRLAAAVVAPMASRRTSASAGSKSGEPACRLDASHRRVVDLQLPSIDGTTVSLGDIDADVILLDFWGSWCRECRTSLEHHREVQERLGTKRLQVIGIACEKGSTPEARRAAAAAAARTFGINYPVLVTSMDGACPVQKALQVQFYPSMILLDREGNILQFEQGATDATLARIDRAIDKALRDGDR